MAEGRAEMHAPPIVDAEPPLRDSAAAHRRPSAPADALSAAFARGCGLDRDQLGSLNEVSLETLGRLFQSLVAGTLQLIHARSSTKDELRAHMTMIATSGNNPLKFAPDAQAAMLQLVGRGLPGFMPPVEAVRDAFADLSAHQVGLLAASRSAMYAMAGRLSPEHIQQRVGGPRGFSGLLPSAHKAQLWDAFVAAHTQLLGEAREEFDAAFQGAFVDAYEGEVRRVQSGGAA
jgi:FHA domain-containing protein